MEACPRPHNLVSVSPPDPVLPIYPAEPESATFQHIHRDVGRIIGHYAVYRSGRPCIDFDAPGARPGGHRAVGGVAVAFDRGVGIVVSCSPIARRAVGEQVEQRRGGRAKLTLEVPARHHLGVERVAEAYGEFDEGFSSALEVPVEAAYGAHADVEVGVVALHGAFAAVEC